MLFQIEEADRFESAYADLLERIQNALQQTYHEEQIAHGITKTAIAGILSIDLSVVSRRLNGIGNVTLRSISDTYTAMNREPLSNFIPPGAPGLQITNVTTLVPKERLPDRKIEDPNMKSSAAA
jgi:hypothetical protein